MRLSSSPKALRGPVPLVHLLLNRFLHAGDQAIDATCGNGKDTVLLAELVGTDGLIHAFDIQAEAITRTAERLNAAGYAERVRFYHTGHEQLAALVATPQAAVIFNLGWLPGADRAVATRAETTLPALNDSLALLKPGGILLITCYPGHSGGDTETEAVTAWAADLAADRFHVWRMAQQNVTSNAPFCLLIQKVPTTHAA